MRIIQSFLNIKAWRHVTVETKNVNMNLNMSMSALTHTYLLCVFFDCVDICPMSYLDTNYIARGCKLVVPRLVLISRLDTFPNSYAHRMVFPLLHIVCSFYTLTVTAQVDCKKRNVFTLLGMFS